MLWLAPASAIEKHAALGPTSSYDVLALCVQAAIFTQAMPSIDEALAHVGAPRQ